jgi:hypothetical protein
VLAEWGRLNTQSPKKGPHTKCSIWRDCHKDREMKEMNGTRIEFQRGNQEYSHGIVGEPIRFDPSTSWPVKLPYLR